MPLRSTLRATIAAVALVWCLAAGSADLRAAQVGVNVAPTSGDYFTSAAMHRAIARLRPAWVRVFMGWNALEPASGVYDTARLDDYRRFFASLPGGTKVDLDIEGTPAWASGSPNVATPPTDDGSFAGFASHIANAFAAGSPPMRSATRRTRPPTGRHRRPVRGLLHAAYAAVKSADRDASVLVGGFAGNDFQYLSAVYAAGARGSFDAVAVHTDDACDVTSPTCTRSSAARARSTAGTSSASRRSTRRWSPTVTAPSRS